MAHRRRILQNFVLVWLDGSIDETSDDYQKSFNHLYHIVPSIEAFKDSDECLKYVATLKEEKIFMIVTGHLEQRIVPKIHENKNLDSVYVFCGNIKLHQQWCEQWSKIQGIHADIKAICEKLRKDRARCERDATPISHSGIDPSFMYTQLIKESLVDMEDDNQQQAIEKFVSYCRDQGNIAEVELEKFEKGYKAAKAIWWYTGEFFLYPMLNRALRAFDIDTILVMGFFIRHLHQQLEEEHKKQQFGHKPFEVYRGQGLPRENFEKLQIKEHGLISFNNFFSTSLDKDVSFVFAKYSLADPNNVGILFVIQIDPSRCRSTPFAQLDHISYFEDTEKEILFSTHTIFRIDEIKPIADRPVDRLWQVELSLAEENDNELHELTKNIRNELHRLDRRDRLGRILIKSGQLTKATKLYEMLLESTQNDRQRALYNNQLGWAY